MRILRYLSHWMAMCWILLVCPTTQQTSTLCTMLRTSLCNTMDAYGVLCGRRIAMPSPEYVPLLNRQTAWLEQRQTNAQKPSVAPYIPKGSNETASMGGSCSQLTMGGGLCAYHPCTFILHTHSQRLVVRLFIMKNYVRAMEFENKRAMLADAAARERRLAQREKDQEDIKDAIALLKKRKLTCGIARPPAKEPLMLLGMKVLIAKVVMHGRRVTLEPIDSASYEKCADCDSSANILVKELNRHTTNPSYWYWCGHCSIGG